MVRSSILGRLSVDRFSRPPLTNHAEGEVRIDGADILVGKGNIASLRAKVGMVFQRPTPFPLSIYENIAFPLRLYNRLSATDMDRQVETA
jgi:phosphate transport system ATP-binding protein